MEQWSHSPNLPIPHPSNTPLLHYSSLLIILLIGLFILPVFFFLSTPPLTAQEKEKAQVDVMDMSLEDLLNVEFTTAGEQTEKIGEIPAGIVLVTREDIKKYGCRSLAEILENIPGLCQTGDFFVKSFGVRGSWNGVSLRYVIVLVDGVRQVETLTGANMLQQINLPLETIDRIEVVRGPLFFIYGTGAFFCVINIFTNQVNENETIKEK